MLYKLLIKNGAQGRSLPHIHVLRDTGVLICTEI